MTPPIDSRIGLIDLLPAVVFEYTFFPDGRRQITYLSPRCEELSRVDPETFIREQIPIHSLIHPDDITLFDLSVEEILLGLKELPALLKQQMESAPLFFRIVVLDKGSLERFLKYFIGLATSLMEAASGSTLSKMLWRNSVVKYRWRASWVKELFLKLTCQINAFQNKQYLSVPSSLCKYKK